MIDQMLAPLQYDYMIKAILVSGFLGGVCAMLSCFVTLKGWSLMGDALSHAIVPGVAIAYIVGIPFSIGAFVSGMVAAIIMGLVKSRTRLREDAVIGIVFTSFFALGVVLISLNPSNISLKTIVFGNILGIDRSDIAQSIIISTIALSVILIKWKDLLLFAFDPIQAKAIGLNTTHLHLLTLTLLSATAVAALQAVGACLVVAMLVTPGATAYLLTDRFGKMLILASIMGTLTSLIGAYGSYFLNGSVGGCIVTLQTAIFLIALMFAQARCDLFETESAPCGSTESIDVASGGDMSIDRLIEPFMYGFMLKGMFMAALVGAVCAILSCYLVLKGWSLMGDAVSHAVLPGIVIAYIVGLPLALGAFAAGLVCAASTGWIKNHSRIKEDTVMGVVFTGLFAFGLLLFTKIETDLHLNHILFGNMLGIEPGTMIQAIVISGVTLIIVIATRKDLLLFLFDRNQAQAVGLNITFLHYLLLALLSATIVAALQAVGIILTVAMLITPGCIGHLLTDRFDRMMTYATVSAVFSAVFGSYLSYLVNCPPGALIVLTQAAIFVLVLLFGPKYGLLFRYRRREAKCITA